MEAEFADFLVKQFDIHDKNGDGKMKLEQVHALMEKHGFRKHQAKKFMSKYDENHNQIVSKSQFQLAVSEIQPCKLKEAQFRHSIQQFDPQKSGKVDKTHLENCACKCPRVNKQDLDLWIKQNDPHNTGMVDYEEFIKTFSAKH